MAIQKGKKGGRRPIPLPDEVNVVSPDFIIPPAVRFDPHEVAKIQLWLDRCQVQFGFRIEDMTLDKASGAVNKWRDGQVHYWSSAVKFMKWMSHTIGRQCSGPGEPESGE